MNTYFGQLQEISSQMNNCPERLDSTVEQAVENYKLANTVEHKNITNIKSDNWVYGNLTEVEFAVKLFSYMAAHNVTACPLEAPFVLKGSEDCSNCSEEAPYFDLSLEACVDCPQGTSFNLTRHQCVAPEAAQCREG